MSKKFPTALAGRLALVRTQANLTGRQLSELAKVAPGLVSQVERGAIASPKATVLGRIAQILGASLDWLVLGVGSPPSKEATLAAVEQARQPTGRPKKTTPKAAA